MTDEINNWDNRKVSLSKKEKQHTLNIVAAVNNNSVPIVFGIGGNNTAALVDDLKTYDLSNVDAILSASPYYNKPTQEGIYQHYKGSKYEVLGLARHSETEEELVMYRALYGDYGLWVRPLSMFLEKVLVEGVKVSRFQLIESKIIRLGTFG